MIGVFHPFLRVAFRVLTADQNGIAGFRAPVDTGVAICGVAAGFLEVDAPGGRNVVDLVAQGASLDIHPIFNPCHAVDDERMRSGHVDDDGRVDLRAILQRHAEYAAVGAPDVDDFGIEHEFASMCLRSPHNVMRGKLRVVDVARTRRVNCPMNLLCWLLPEALVFRASRWVERILRVDGHPLAQRLQVPLLKFDANVPVKL